MKSSKTKKDARKTEQRAKYLESPKEMLEMKLIDGEVESVTLTDNPPHKVKGLIYKQ